MTINELRAKRSKAWEAAKAFLETHTGNNGILSAEDGQHKLALRRFGVDVLLLADKLDALPLQLIHQIQEVPGASGESADTLDNQHVTLPNKAHHFLQLRPVGVLPGDLLNVDLLHAQLLHEDFLPDGVLPLIG